MTIKPQSSVLLVDDDADTREMYAWSLESRGFHVVTAGNATQALKLAAACRPDVIVSDFTLPGGDGFSLATNVRREPSLADTPLVLASGRAFVGESADAAMRLFDRVMVKPILPDDLITEIIPLILDRASARLEREIRQVRDTARRAPTSSHASRTLLFAVAEATSAEADASAALVAGTDARYVAVNDAACALIGRPREEILSLAVWDLVEEPGPRARQAWAQFLTDGTMAGAYALRSVAGAPIHTLFHASAHVLPDHHLSLLRPVPQALRRGR